VFSDSRLTSRAKISGVHMGGRWI